MMQRRTPSQPRAAALSAVNAYSFLLAAAVLAATLLIFFIRVPSAHAQTSATGPAHGFPHSLFYVTNTKSAITSLRLHVSAMDIVAPQIYAATPTGKLLGVPRDEVLALSHDAGVQIMPLVVNQYFSQEGMHALLTDDAAQNTLLTALIAEAKARGYIGFQYDFEHMAVADKDLYSAFVAKSAPVLHASGLQLSVAVGPKHSDFAADYGVGSWENWTGAFDYAAIGRSADFVSVMAYDDSRSAGPVASLPWVKSVVDYSLKYIPAEKISLGIAFYAWVKDTKTDKRYDIVTYPAIAKLLTSKKQVVERGWDASLGSSYVVYKKNKKTLIAWYEDQRSFKQKLALIDGEHLRGFSAWALGQEDPANWNVIATLRLRTPVLALSE